MDITNFIFGLAAALCSALLVYTLTPPVRVLAYLIGAVDVPTDSRRMHVKPTPRIGGLAIFAGFVVAALVFGKFNRGLWAILSGGAILVVLGIIDDVKRLPAWVKFLVQIGAAALAVSFGLKIDYITIFGMSINFGMFSIPITILWIVALTNAINLIDGLDGLACGVSGIMSLSLLGVVLIQGDFESAIITAVLAGACFGFLPYNTNPARIFMGDTGALFLGYTLSIISIQGMFKLHAVLSFIVPLSLFALPLLDTATAFIRRIIHRESPFTPDRKHLHHKLVDLGFSQKEAVRLLYAVCGMLGLVAITFTERMFGNLRLMKALIVLGAAFLVFGINYLVMKKTSTRILSGLTDHGNEKSATPLPGDAKPTEEAEAPSGAETTVETTGETVEKSAEETAEEDK
ncbi:MAG: undecaprenyl/decaprenyl-phosphate alpha-N-acetylglucosaminyl 1-phosphate transferase [Clostridia bacterium]|nr:undecaprenyl/decaprenyl-phosphate alpha-N-acetylglucosaminyl 1-phosphate transferase [Clostridia bacterium]